MQNSNRGILIAILAVVSLNLIVTSIQLGFELRPTNSTPRTETANETLPASYSPALLHQIAQRVIVPYNKGDGDALYAQLDSVTKNELPLKKFMRQFRRLKTLIGNVQSASFSGFQTKQSQGSLTIYQLHYVVKLSDSTLPSGVMTINVLDRSTGPGILGFFIYGKSSQ